MMGRGWVAMGVVTALALFGCGPGGSIPQGPDGTQNPGDGGLTIVPPGDGGEQTATALWPLNTGSRWKYKVTDPVRGVFEKTVEVVGIERVPNTSTDAVHVKSVQPHLEEHSWQALTQDGLVVRLREDDLKEGALARSTTWTPANVKSLAEAKDASWTHAAVVTERTTFNDGTFEDKDRTYNWKVLGVNVAITTAAGTFENALQVERSRPDKEDWVRVYWLVPGIGKVYETGERTEELIEYEIK